MFKQTEIEHLTKKEIGREIKIHKLLLTVSLKLEVNDVKQQVREMRKLIDC